MPPKYLFDISSLDLNAVVFDIEAIRRVNPHRGDMEQLSGIAYVDKDTHRIVGFKDVAHDEFWVAGHIPGRPLLPGVLMIEAGAQLASFYTKQILGWDGFIGFGGVTDVRFRQQVTPGCRLYILCQQLWDRHRRICCGIQGVIQGNLVFEAEIIGTQM